MKAGKRTGNWDAHIFSRTEKWCASPIPRVEVVVARTRLAESLYYGEIGKLGRTHFFKDWEMVRVPNSGPGGNIAECFVTGEVAGRNASAAAPWDGAA